MRLSSQGGLGGGKRGFTLLEVLIAMVLFFVAVTYFSLAYLNTLNVMESVSVKQGLEQDMSTIRRQALFLSDPAEVDEGGTVQTGEHGQARWEVEYEPTQVADLFLVTLKVEWEPKEEGGVSEVVEQYYLTRPSWSEPTERDELRARTRERLVDRQLNASRR